MRSRMLVAAWGILSLFASDTALAAKPESSSPAAGDRLHTATGTIAITAIEAGPRAEAYSLVVDEFNTYFVGQSKVLGHDNNLRQPTDSVVPGLTAQR